MAARQRVLERDDSKEENWRIQGSGRLEPYGLACLNLLWHWRDAEAKAWDRPSFMVATNRQLLEWSSELAAGKKVTLPHHYRPERVKRFVATAAAIKDIPESEWPERSSGKRRKRDKNFERKVDELIRRRESITSKLDIEDSLIASRAVLESIAAGEASPSQLLLKWQCECLDLAD